MDESLKKYLQRTSKSRAIYERAESVLPGGVSHGIRFFPPYPFYVNSGKGSRIWDVDGNEYVDYWMGHLALILGHNHPVVVDAVRQQLEDGVHWGAAHPDEVELAELILGTVPCAEAVRFCNTGAEATMYAVRLARGYTGRSVILKAEGGWHGFCTDLLVAVHGPFDRPESLGLPSYLGKEVATFGFNDVEGAVEAIRKARDLAGVIVEPVLGAGGSIPADKEFLQALREETARKDALLIFDEIITGFRLSVGGAQEYFGIRPDLAALGKILGGGLPVGAVVGSQESMELANPVGPGREGQRVSIGGGTFSGNPISMAAGLAAVRYLAGNKEGYERIGRMGERVRKELSAVFTDHGLAVACTGLESMFQAHFLREEGASIRNARDVHFNTDHRRRKEEFKLRLANEGVYTMHGGGALSMAHTEEDMKQTLEALEKVARDMGRKRR